MANRIEGVRERILECAKEEFLENGYERASIRTIANNANTSTNSIYVRFTDKENLYRTIVDKVANGFINRLEIALQGFDKMSKEEQEKCRNTYAKEGSLDLISYIYDNFDYFKILIMSGEYKIYQEFLHKIVDMDTVYTVSHIEKIGNDAITSGRLTIDFAHMLSVAFYSGFFEIIVHDMKKEEAQKYIEKLRKFYTTGWETIFNEGNER